MVASSVPVEGSVKSRATSSLAAQWMARLLDSSPAGGGSSSEQRLALASLQGHCRSRLAGRPLPSRREEAWRFTDPTPLTAITPALLVPPAPPPPPGGSSAGGSLRLVCDGFSDPLDGVTLPPGIAPIPASALGQVLCGALTATGCDEHWGILLNGSLVQRVLALRVTGVVDQLVEIHSDAAGGEGVLPLRILLLMDEGAQLDLLQVHTASGPSLTSAVLEGHLGAGARLRHSLVTRGTDSSALLVHLALRQSAGSELQHTSVSLGWGFARYEPRVIQADGDATSLLRGLQLVGSHQLADTHSHVHFAGPGGTLDQLHKAVADQEGHSVFNGAVRVPRQAQRTNASQMSRNLLLSNRARIDTKPELEIVADDVRCAHGATVSCLEPEELFYLRSRGIASDRAARLLLRGFCEEVLAPLPPQASAALQGWLTFIEPGQ